MDHYGLDKLRSMCKVSLCQDIAINKMATTLALAEQHYYSQLKPIRVSQIHCNFWKFIRCYANRWLQTFEGKGMKLFPMAVTSMNVMLDKCSALKRVVGSGR
ncbi:hypothetical protein FF1_043780 [Malus domestica]